MRSVLRTSLALALGAALTFARAARAEPPAGGDKQRAAAAFDAAVAKFKRAEFAEAARGFLEADTIAPSAVAITNAIAAARRANDHLLVARLSERALTRGDAVVEARAALAEAATRLAKLDLACDASPCALAIDGEPAGATAWVLPGTRRIEARGSGGAAAEERIIAVAGATYGIALHPALAPKAEVRAPSGLHPAVFFTGAGVTAVLAGITLWSGMDAIAAKRALPKDAAEQAQIDDVLGRARRTDWLLLGAGIAGLGTTALGVFFTSFRRAPVTAAVVPVPGGVAVAAGGAIP